MRDSQLALIEQALMFESGYKVSGRRHVDPWWQVVCILMNCRSSEQTRLQLFTWALSGSPAQLVTGNVLELPRDCTTMYCSVIDGDAQGFRTDPALPHLPLRAQLLVAFRTLKVPRPIARVTYLGTS